GHYLKRWGFTPQKPIRKAYEQRPAEVQTWLNEEFPAIADRAKTEGAEIHWGDETGLRSDDVRGRGYAPKGQTPVVRICNKRENVSLIST
ncbi:winged helix-turn-helix domain-containing protein, partial [Campylobacter coli]